MILRQTFQIQNSQWKLKLYLIQNTEKDKND